MFSFSKRAGALLFVAVVALGLSAFPQTSYAKAKYNFKIGSLAPEGSIWVTQFRTFAKEVTEKTNGEVAFRIYGGGIMGDDQAMYRKMRVRQLHGGGFTMSGIANIIPNFRVMAIPFLFDSYDEIDHVRKGMVPLFKDNFEKKGLHFLSFTEVGFVYAMSNKSIATFDEIQATKNWTPAGDDLSTNFLQKAGISSTQLALPDVLSSLQTGLVETVYNSLYGSIVLQWFTSLDYVNNLPSGYAYGVILLDGKSFKKMPKEYQEIVDVTAAKYFDPLIATTRKTNAESREILIKNGLIFQEPGPETVEKMTRYQTQVIEEAIQKGLFSQEAYDKMMKLLSEQRGPK